MAVNIVRTTPVFNPPFVIFSAEAKSQAPLRTSISELELTTTRGASLLGQTIFLIPAAPSFKFAALSSQAWLSVDQTFGTLHGTQPLRLTLDPTGLPLGLHFATLSVYDSNGQVAAQVLVQLRIVSKAPIHISSKALHFSESGQSMRLNLHNPNSVPVHYALSIDNDSFSTPESEGSLPPMSTSTIEVSAANPQSSQWQSANLVMAFDQREMELVTLSLQPGKGHCASAPPVVHIDSPGEHHFLHADGIAQFLVIVRDGCGQPLKTGNLVLIAPHGKPIFPYRHSDGSWHANWKPGATQPAINRIDAYWSDPASGRTASTWTQIAIHPK